MKLLTRPHTQLKIDGSIIEAVNKQQGREAAERLKRHVGKEEYILAQRVTEDAPGIALVRESREAAEKLTGPDKVANDEAASEKLHELLRAKIDRPAFALTADHKRSAGPRQETKPEAPTPVAPLPETPTTNRSVSKIIRVIDADEIKRRLTASMTAAAPYRPRFESRSRFTTNLLSAYQRKMWEDMKRNATDSRRQVGHRTPFQTEFVKTFIEQRYNLRPERQDSNNGEIIRLVQEYEKIDLLRKCGGVIAAKVLENLKKNGVIKESEFEIIREDLKALGVSI